jgi:PilZ domain-containing protein
MNEHRREPRSEEQADVSVRVRTAPEAEALEGKIFPSHSEDVSMSGMKLNIDTPVPIGAILDLEVMLSNSPIKYEMTANVVWADESADSNMEQDSGCDVGVILSIQSNSQLALWNAAVSDL